MTTSSYHIPKRVLQVIELLREGGAAECMLVGGWVRDQLLGIASKDYDLEVYGLDYDRIVELLRPHYRVELVGKSFGVVKVGNWLDINIPRRESKYGVGHKGFSIETDPGMTPLEATGRRDFTINAIGLLADGSLYDPYGGHDDLQKGLLRATTDAFCEDPLRVLRGMQFAGRFGFAMDEKTVAMCRAMVGEFETLSAERIWEEWHKWAAKSRYPSRGLQLLVDTGWIENFPELAALKDLPQHPEWHPEGDVLTHTMHCVDQAVQIADREGFDEQGRTILVLAVLCHDFGKALTTFKDRFGRWVSPEHDKKGVEPSRVFLERMRSPGWVVEHVTSLVGEHMTHVYARVSTGPTERAVRRLANRLAPSNIHMWAAMVEADSKGRPPKTARRPIDNWLAIADRLELREAKPEPIILGRHLIELGVKPGPEMGRILDEAFEAQLDGKFINLDAGIIWLRENFDV